MSEPAAPNAASPAMDDPRPVVAPGGRPRALWPIVSGGVILGVIVFLWLNTRRSHDDDLLKTARTQGDSQSFVSSAPPPRDLALEEAAARGGVSSPGAQPAPLAVTATGAAPATLGPPSAAAPDLAAVQRFKAPALVVDLGDSDGGESGPGPAPTTAAAAAAGSQKPGAQPPSLSGNEQFADRVSAELPERSQATVLHNRAALVAQGATITGVLETALNSDLPGFARAVVSRDVLGFDGTQVLIPRGSRVIGEYKSAVAQGQSRAFVIWTRIIRPDGVSIQIGSSGTDPLGRAGLSGKVNTHFFERFSGAVLLSVITAGIQSISRPSTQIVIGSSTDAATASLAALAPTVIPPTIKIAQGSAIRIFVARDLDFSTVAGAGK